MKIKVGGDLNLDIARIENALAVNPNYRVRLDVNGGWSVKEAIDSVSQIIERIGIEKIEYIEQPVATLEELRELDLPIPVVGDEVIRKSEDPFAVDLNGAVDILMLKVSPLGGINRAKAIAAHHKLPVVVSSALESAVGINYGLKLAASFENLDFDCGLATGSLLSADVGDLPIINGEIAISEFEPNLAGLEVSPDRYEWWKNRVLETAEKIK